MARLSPYIRMKMQELPYMIEKPLKKGNDFAIMIHIIRI